MYIKVKLSLYRPGQASRVPRGGKVVSSYAPAAFIPQKIFLLLISVSG
jgi:hypothetical protein